MRGPKVDHSWSFFVTDLRPLLVHTDGRRRIGSDGEALASSVSPKLVCGYFHRSDEMADLAVR